MEKKEKIISNLSSGDGNRSTFERPFRRWRQRNNDIATNLVDVFFWFGRWIFVCFFFVVVVFVYFRQNKRLIEQRLMRAALVDIEHCVLVFFHSFALFFIRLRFFHSRNGIDCSNEIEPKFILSHTNIHMFRASAFFQAMRREWRVECVPFYCCD